MSRAVAEDRRESGKPGIPRRSFLELAGAAGLALGGELLTRAGRAYPAEVGKTVPGIVAHQSALQDGQQLDVPQFD